jgi:ABC-type arginine transport system permease subunit
VPSSRRPGIAVSPLVVLATVYTTIIRGIPELVLMLLVFYGGSIGINNLLETGWAARPRWTSTRLRPAC